MASFRSPRIESLTQHAQFTPPASPTSSRAPSTPDSSSTVSSTASSGVFDRSPSMSPPPQEHQKGRIELIIGPMFAGKSTELIRRVRRYSRTRKNCLVIKYKADTRYSVESVSTHDRVEHRAESCSELKEVDHLLEGMDVVAIDEGQFFPDLLNFSDRVANSGRIVIIACLDADFLRKPFGDVCNLVPRAELITKLTAVCNRCTADAAFTLRTTNATQQELIGGAEMYEPVCRSCHLRFCQPQNTLQNQRRKQLAPNENETFESIADLKKQRMAEDASIKNLATTIEVGIRSMTVQ
jgi:thymidine kinase